MAKNNRIEGDFFQYKMSDSNANTSVTGQNILKKSPGFTVLKYSLVAITEAGMLLSTATALTNEL